MTAAARAGCTLASFVLESVGTQEYTVTSESFLERAARGYGAEAAAELGGLVGAVPVGVPAR